MLAGFYRVFGEIGVRAIFENDVVIYFDLNENRPMRLPRAAAKTVLNTFGTLPTPATAAGESVE